MDENAALDRSLRQTSKPSISGMLMSRRIRSGGSSAAAASASTGIAYIALCRPVALNASVMVLAPASIIALWAKKSLKRPVPTGPMLAPKMYMKQK